MGGIVVGLAFCPLLAALFRHTTSGNGEGMLVYPTLAKHILISDSAYWIVKISVIEYGGHETCSQTTVDQMLGIKPEGETRKFPFGRIDQAFAITEYWGPSVMKVWITYQLFTSGALVME